MISRCEGCGYMYPDFDRVTGETTSGDYCHYDGPDAWCPCEQDDYNYLNVPDEDDFFDAIL